MMRTVELDGRSKKRAAIRAWILREMHNNPREASARPLHYNRSFSSPICIIV